MPFLIRLIYTLISFLFFKFIKKNNLDPKINNNYEYEIYDKDNLKSCDIKIKNDNIQKNINIEDGKICDSEIHTLVFHHSFLKFTT